MQSLPPLLSLQGSIAPGEKQVLKVYYLPGELGVFHKTFQVQVAYLEPAEITLKGKGTFPRVTKNILKMLEGEHYLLSSRKIPWIFAHQAAHTHLHKSGSCRDARPTLWPLWLLPEF